METINHECYVPSKVVTLLTKAGFDWKDYFVAHDINEHFHWEIPLHIAQKWLREVKHWEINIMWFPAEPQYIGVSKEHYTWTLQMQIKIGLKNEPNTFIYDTIMKKDGEKYATYEEAQEEGIKKALELILEEGE